MEFGPRNHLWESPPPPTPPPPGPQSRGSKLSSAPQLRGPGREEEEGGGGRGRGRLGSKTPEVIPNQEMNVAALLSRKYEANL